MIVSSTQDRIIEIWAPSTALLPCDENGVPINKNYYRDIGRGGKELAADNPANEILYQPLQQSSMIINQDTLDAYTYVIDSNPGALHGQTGHWNKM